MGTNSFFLGTLIKKTLSLIFFHTVRHYNFSSVSLNSVKNLSYLILFVKIILKNILRKYYKLNFTLNLLIKNLAWLF